MSRHELTDGTIDPAFAALTPEHRADVWALEDVMRGIDAERNKVAACRAASAQLGHARGYSYDRLRSKYYAWVRAGRCWSALVDHARAPAKRKVPRHLMDVAYKTYCERHQRANKRAWAALMMDIRRGVRIDGVGDWRDLWRACYPGETPPAKCPVAWVPPGMTYRNLQTYARLTPFEATVARIGTKAARAHVPGVYSTRGGLRPGQLYQFDDVWHDIEIVMPGAARSMVRPLEFACIDVASTNKIASGLRPQIPLEDGTKESLKEIEMLWIVCHVLTDVGWHRGGCVWCVEHGTAAVREATRKTIDRLTGGAIRYRDADILGKAIHQGMWGGSGKGNFRTKGLIEASHRLLHYEMAMLPGQTGGISRGGDRPEQLDGLERYARDILTAWQRLPRELQERLWFGGLSWSGYGRIVSELNHAIYSRHEHDIEGWEANEWLEPEWSVDGRGEWRATREIAGLPAAMQDLALAAIRTPGLTRMRRWSPIEAWQSGECDLVRMPAWGVVDILGMDRVKRVRVQPNHLISFEDRALGPGAHRFAGWVACPDGSSMPLTPGREYGIFATPYSTRQAVVVDLGNGTVLGVAPQWAQVNPLDAVQVSTMQEMQGRVASAMAAPLIERHRDEADDRLAAMAHNKILIESAQDGGRTAIAPRKPARTKPQRDLLADLASAGARTTQQPTETTDESW